MATKKLPPPDPDEPGRKVYQFQPGNQHGAKNSKYEPSHDRRAFKLALLGLTDEEIADHFEIAVSTLYLWKEKHPTFSEAINAGKTDADGDIAESLYFRAKGGMITTQQAFKVKTGDKARPEAVVVVDVQEYVPPDTAAAKHWLANRQRGKWNHGRRPMVPYDPDMSEIEADSQKLEIMRDKVHDNLIHIFGEHGDGPEGDQVDEFVIQDAEIVQSDSKPAESTGTEVDDSHEGEPDGSDEPENASGPAPGDMDWLNDFFEGYEPPDDA